jgi:hypothetical protein
MTTGAASGDHWRWAARKYWMKSTRNGGMAGKETGAWAREARKDRQRDPGGSRESLSLAF